MNSKQLISQFSLCLLAWSTLVVAPTSAQTITHIPLYTFHGDSEGDRASAVSGAGDVNGDGFDDIIVGAYGDDNNGRDSGSVRVFSGVDGSLLYNFDGDPLNDLISDFFGGSVSGAGDVNNDGFADVIVGAIGDDNNGTNSGSVRVFSGVDGSVLYNFDGDASLDLLGTVSDAGDVNNDGFADMIVGAYGDDNNVRGGGNASVLSGVDGSVLYSFDGDSEFEQFGRSVSGAGDVNGDGYADVIVGSQFDDTNGSSSGSARVLSGIDGSTLYTFAGNSNGDRFGWSVSGAGDVNGDGFTDLIVGAWNLDVARVLSGVDGSVLYNFNGDTAGDKFSTSVSGAGDVNGDGFADLIVGARNDDNNGNLSGSARVVSGFDGSVLYNFDGDSAEDRFGWAVSDAGDVNGDGLADFIVGADRGGDSNGGYARVFVSQITDTLLGDCNLDGTVNFFDISPFIAILADETFLAEADCNADGVVNFFDIAPFIENLVVAN